MKSKSFALLARGLVLAGSLLSLAGFPVEETPNITWTLGPRSPFSGTRFDGEYLPAVGRVYFLGFRTLADATDGSVWYYDVATGVYTDTLVDMPVPISNYQVAALRDANGLGLYTFGGRDATAVITDTVQVYYPATNTTAMLASDTFPGKTPAGCISLPAMGVAVVRNRAIVMGGLSFASTGCVDDQSTETWVFDPLAPAGSRWTAGPPLNVARGYITPAVIGRRIFAIGGDTISAGSLFASATVEMWNFPVGGWNDAAVADLPVACDESQAFGFSSGALARMIVLAGCGQWPNAVPDSYTYDAVGNTWALSAPLNHNRRNHAGAVINVGGAQTLYILGGYGENSGFIDPIRTSETSPATPLGGPLISRQPRTAPAGPVPTN